MITSSNLKALKSLVTRFDLVATNLIDYSPIIKDLHTLLQRHQRPLNKVNWKKMQTYVHDTHGILIEPELLKKFLTNYIDNNTNNL